MAKTHGPGRTVPASDPDLTGATFVQEDADGVLGLVSAASVLAALAEIDSADRAAAGIGAAFSLTQSQILVAGSQYFAGASAIAAASLPSATLTNAIGDPGLRTIRVIAAGAGTVTVVAPTGSLVAGGSTATVAPGAFKAFAPAPGTANYFQVG